MSRLWSGLALCAALAGISAASHAASAKAVLLQTVDLNELSMSTEGGVAKLSRLSDSRHGRCEISVVHYGETGRQSYRFVFANKLNYAVMREHRYSVPISIAANPKVSLAKQVLLTSPQGQVTLPKEFDFYRSMFDSAKLKQCVVRKAR